MKTDKNDIERISESFKKMQSTRDLLEVLNDAKKILYGEKAKPFQLYQITWYANPKLGKNRYKEFSISKKSGKERKINAPVPGLKMLQRVISFVLQCVYEPQVAAYGFVWNRSIVDNAKLHVGSKYVYNIDLKDFFSTIEKWRVWKCLQLAPFSLVDIRAIEIKPHHTSKATSVVTFDNGFRALASIEGAYNKTDDNYIPKFLNEDGTIHEEWDIRKINEVYWICTRVQSSLFDGTPKITPRQSNRAQLANIISGICCTELEVERKDPTGFWVREKRLVIPQGAPTSPVISNIVCQKLDFLLSGVAKRFGLKYSRYADDITFSSNHNVYQDGSDFISELNRIINEQGFFVKESKTRLQKEGYRMEVTGLLVNEKVNVQKRYIKQLRMWLYYWEQYGYEKASEFFLRMYLGEKQLKKGQRPPQMQNVLNGKLQYLKMVVGKENPMFIKLKDRFDKLATPKAISVRREKYLEMVLNVAINSGIEPAMKLYTTKQAKLRDSNDNSNKNPF